MSYNYKPFKDLFIPAIEEVLSPIESAKTSFKLFNKYTGGFRPREFSIFCGSSGSGKTTMMANLSASLLEQGIQHFVASVETGHHDFVRRVCSAMSGIDINTGEVISTHIAEKIVDDYNEIIKQNKLNISLYEDRFSVESLIEELKYQHDTYGCKVAIIDNLNFFLEVTAANMAIIEMDRVIHNLIIFCKTIDMHIIMVMHPKKSQYGTKVQTEYDIKGSSTAVQEAHNIFIWNRLTDEDVEDYRTPIPNVSYEDRELRIVKMRRRGMAVGSRIIFGHTNGVKYHEKGSVK